MENDNKVYTWQDMETAYCEGVIAAILAEGKEEQSPIQMWENGGNDKMKKALAFQQKYTVEVGQYKEQE